MRNIIMMLAISSISFSCLAEGSDFEAAVNLAKSEGQRKKVDSFNLAKKFNPGAVFTNYSSNPDETKYYDGDQEKNIERMKIDASQQKSNGVGADISDSINQHPRFVINKSDPDMQHAQLIQSEAYNIIHGVTSQYIDCKPKQACTAQYQEKKCEEAPQTIFQSCNKKLDIDIISHENVTHYTLIARLSVKKHDYAGISINAVNGNIDSQGPHDTNFILDGRLPGNIDCHTWQGKIVSSEGKANLDHINFPSCANGLALDFHISRGHKLNLQIDMASKVVTYEVKDQWIDSCSSIQNDSTCKLKSQQCDIPSSTKNIQGIPVTRDCWQHKFDYICRGGSGDGNCKLLQSQGCEQIGSQCSSESSGHCSLYQQTYRCLIQSCSPTTDIVCGNGQEYCLDGNCTDHSYQQSQDFAKGVSALSAIADAGKQLDQSALKIFTGHPAECSEKPVGFSNCCAETGWGQGMGLDHCPDAAKKLHEARKNKLVIKVGRYCSGSDPFPCLVHNQVFCVFSSKLAKIIQEQGRFSQRHIDFGSAKEPKCRGITIEELQAIDLSKIDFQEFINDLNQNIKTHDLKQIQELIQQHIQHAQQTGQANG